MQTNRWTTSKCSVRIWKASTAQVMRKRVFPKRHTLSITRQKYKNRQPQTCHMNWILCPRRTKDAKRMPVFKLNVKVPKSLSRPRISRICSISLPLRSLLICPVPNFLLNENLRVAPIPNVFLLTRLKFRIFMLAKNWVRAGSELPISHFTRPLEASLRSRWSKRTWSSKTNSFNSSFYKSSFSHFWTTLSSWKSTAFLTTNKQFTSSCNTCPKARCSTISRTPRTKNSHNKTRQRKSST